MNNRSNKYDVIPSRLNSIGKEIVDAAYIVHKNLGPGLLEKIYEACLVYELNKKGLKTERQVPIAINYDGVIFDEGLQLDVLVENEVICELKAVDKVNPVWEAQILSHLKLTKKRLGYLINFNVKNIGRGTKRFVL
ncbi:MAG: GxxExxY protein [Balneolaceae bacterium]